MEKNNNQLLRIENFLARDDQIDIESNDFKKLMFIYSVAIKEIQNKLEIIKDEFKVFYNYDLIDHINTRIKKPKSILKKMDKKLLNNTYKDMILNVNDIAGIRVICPLKKDIYSVRNLIGSLNGVKIIKEKDYVIKPKESGYSSYHLIIEVPVILSQKNVFVKVEIQIRTLAMDFWASLEHSMKYKSEGKIDKKKSKQLIEYAKIINKIDSKMMMLNSQ